MGTRSIATNSTARRLRRIVCAELREMGRGYSPPAVPDRTPLVKLRLHLEGARGRGVEFADAWDPAVAVALEGLYPQLRREWWVALCRTRETWEACYERRPATRVEEQLELIAA
jgi:hypothetical protein